LQSRANATWKTVFLPANTREYTFQSGKPDAIALRAVDRCGNLSKAAVVTLKP
jgi:hypothetical protein